MHEYAGMCVCLCVRGETGVCGDVCVCAMDHVLNKRRVRLENKNADPDPLSERAEEEEGLKDTIRCLGQRRPRPGPKTHTCTCMEYVCKRIYQNFVKKVGVTHDYKGLSRTLLHF